MILAEFGRNRGALNQYDISFSLSLSSRGSMSCAEYRLIALFGVPRSSCLCSAFSHFLCTDHLLTTTSPRWSSPLPLCLFQLWGQRKLSLCVTGQNVTDICCQLSFRRFSMGLWCVWFVTRGYYMYILVIFSLLNCTTHYSCLSAFHTLCL